MGQHNQEIIDALKQSHLFSSLDEQQLERVYSHSRIVKLEDGQLLFAQGEDVDYFYLVLSGKIKLFRVSPDGQEKIIEIVRCGGTFAEALMFMDQPHYPVSSAALSDTVVVGIDAKDFKAMLWDSVDTCLLLLGDMSYRLRKLVYEIDVLTLHSGTCRVASYLLQHAPDDQDSFELENAKSVIAARLSVKPETFSRIIKNLRGEGVISIQGSKITIHNREALKTYSLV
ncbi:MAG: Crp/Fnr family transcriptional regulator [Thiotrichales bacterium]|nr:MAG: Crp/Fnr family transcriptional regulator [Thiotrichales bacterium]